MSKIFTVTPLGSRGALTIIMAVMATAPAATAVEPQVVQQVGVPGCASDGPVRASRELINFTSRDRPVRAHLYTPRGRPNGRGIVLLHGGTGFEMNSILFDAHAIQLASKGYWVILPAYFDAAERSQGRSLVVARAWRQAAIDAALYLAAKPGMSVNGVAFWGYSLGGGVAVNAVTALDGPVNAAIAVAAGGDFPRTDGGAGRSVLMMHARRDDIVPVRSTLALADDLRTAGATVEVAEVDFDGHQYDLPTWCVVMDKTRAFLDERDGPLDAPA
jgi:dienelactone hydrolase